MMIGTRLRSPNPIAVTPSNGFSRPTRFGRATTFDFFKEMVGPLFAPFFTDFS